MIFHTIGGLPRSGSTLLCNILNQNPRFWASSTSHIPAALGNLTTLNARSPEINGHAILDADDTIYRLHQSLRGYCEGWYANKEREVIFDKSRTWNHCLSLLKTLWPSARAILLVRDLRSIFSSIEHCHHETAIFDSEENPRHKTMYHRADSLFSPEGIIGSPLDGIEDAIRRNYGNVLLIRYEDFVDKPMEILSAIYDQICEPHFEHDLDNIENTSQDVDALYNFKFPHVGSGKIMHQDPDQWKKWISGDINDLIMKKFSSYNQRFGYI